jgi:predicted flap endonuclease-1-like 5' DNA nuclease
MEREVGVLREHIAQLNEGLADRDRLRTQVKQLETAQDRIHQLEIELSDREAAHRTTIQQLEQTLADRDRRIKEFDALAAAHIDELRGSQQACQAAEQAREVLKEETRVLRDHIAQLNEGLADRDRLRTQVKQLETAQDRIHQLEIELSDREAAHRTMIQQLEQTLADRDRRIEDLVPMTHLLREKEATITEWERTHAQTVQALEHETAKLREQSQVHEDLHARHHLDEQRVLERDEQLAALQGELQALHTERDALKNEVQSIPEKDEQIERLQKRLKELRATLRTPPAATTAPAPQPRQDEEGTTAPSGTSKRSKPAQGDDLKKIQGISPVFAETLQKLGTRTFIQIARWKPEDIEKIAKKLATDPERIKRENWMAAAKKHHFQKYKERL